ncbi:MAG: hypothetical protein ACETWB_06180, partial [Anaerolineae bacterium]
MLTNASGGANRLALSGLKRAVPREVKARAVLMGLLFALILSAILVFQFLPTDQVILDVGDVSPRDIHAPYKKTYVSQVLTEREKAKAEAEVRDVYDPPDPRVARQQVAKARQICDYINSVRHDIYATAEQKYHWIQSIPDLTLPPTVISRTLDLIDEDWQEVADQTVYVLNQAMRRVIQENQLTEAKRTLPTSVSLDLSEEQAEIVIELVKNLIRPNSFYNADKTAEAKGRAGEGALQITQSVEKGESILRQGDIVTALDLEALDQFGLRQTSIKWFDIVGKVLFVLTIALVMGLYLLRFRPDFWISLRYQLLLSSLIMLFVLVAKMMVSGHALLPYLFPLATLSMLLSVLFDPQLAVLVTVLLSATVGLISDGSLEMTAYALFGGIIAALRLGRRVERLNILLWCGTYVALANLAVIFIFRLPDQSNMIDLLPLIGIG